MKTRWILIKRNTDGLGVRTHRQYVLHCKSLLNYWKSVTNIQCPSCKKGMIRWHEAGYVPGYRKCDKCGREFLAVGNASRPALLCSP